MPADRLRALDRSGGSRRNDAGGIPVTEAPNPGRVRVVLGLGSNLGDRLANLRRAARGLEEGGVVVKRCSSMYEGPPVGYPAQPDFLNAVLTGETSLSPFEVLALGLRLEAEAGRERTFQGAPRPLDVDVLSYGDMTLSSETLVLPHPRWSERAFVLAPLAEAAPDLRVPGEERTVAEVWAAKQAHLPALRLVAGPDAIWRQGA